MAETKSVLNWRTMDAGRELDQLVAERLGWTNFSRFYDRYADDGDIESLHGIPRAGGNTEYLVPCYSTDANAALTLFAGLEIQIEFWLGHWQAKYWPDSNTPIEYEDWEQAVTFALAVVRAWLAYHERIG